jgi:hypothetical protein
MQRISSLLVIVAVFVVFSTLAWGAIVTFDGSEKGFWSTHEVLLARIVSVKPPHGQQEGVLSVTISSHVPGTPGITPTLDLTFRTHPFISALDHFSPKPAEFYLLCIERHPGAIGWVLPSFGFSGFISHSAAERVTGPNDPEIATVFARVAAQAQAATRPATTQPSSQPANAPPSS